MRNPFESHSWSSPNWSASWSRLPATAGVVVSTALLAGLGYAVWRTLRTTHASRQGAKPARQPEDLTRWEGEGGGVPVGGSRTASEMDRTGMDAGGMASTRSAGGSATGGLSTGGGTSGGTAGAGSTLGAAAQGAGGSGSLTGSRPGGASSGGLPH